MNPKSNRSSKADRKTIEKNRRNQMKNLYSELNSLVPQHDDGSSSSGDPMTLPDQIDEATNYIKKKQNDVENLRRRRDSLQGGNNYNPSSRMVTSPVQIQVNANGCTLEVTLVTGLESQFVFNEAIRILHEENAEVVNASYSAVEGTVFHTIHAQVAEGAEYYGVARITERLKQFEL